MDSNELEETEDLKIVDEKYLVAFLDILGYKNIVKDYVDKKTDSLDRIKCALKVATSIISVNEDNNSVNTKLKQFSDCTSVAVNYKYIPDLGDNEEQFISLIRFLLIILSYFQIELLRSDLYIRGGLSLGFHYENDNMIFSDGLIKAYELESKAMHPRIILDDEIANILKDLFKTHKDQMSRYGFDKLLVSDWDGLVFINPFDSNALLSDDKKQEAIIVDRKIILEILKNVENKIKYKDEKIRRKYIWLKELINWNLDKNSSKIKFEYFLR